MEPRKEGERLDWARHGETLRQISNIDITGDDIIDELLYGRFVFVRRVLPRHVETF